VLFRSSGTVDWFAVMVSVVAFVGLARLNWGVIPVVAGAAALGLLHWIVKAA
jgi:hypothetical protein